MGLLSYLKKVTALGSTSSKTRQFNNKRLPSEIKVCSHSATEKRIDLRMSLIPPWLVQATNAIRIYEVNPVSVRGGQGASG